MDIFDNIGFCVNEFNTSKPWYRYILAYINTCLIDVSICKDTNIKTVTFVYSYT